jgi:hypothetical protein
VAGEDACPRECPRIGRSVLPTGGEKTRTSSSFVGSQTRPRDAGPDYRRGWDDFGEETRGLEELTSRMIDDAVAALSGIRWPIVDAEANVPGVPGLYAVYGEP